MPYCTYTKLNLYLDLLPVIGFLESLKHKEADYTISANKFWVDFCEDALKGNFSKHNIITENFGKNILGLWLFLNFGYTKVS